MTAAEVADITVAETDITPPIDLAAREEEVEGEEEEQVEVEITSNAPPPPPLVHLLLRAISPPNRLRPRLRLRRRPQRRPLSNLR